MGRYDILEKEINKNKKVDEKSNIIMSDWSPNNVRRLIIGIDFAIVQYFVTGGKYRKTIEVVSFGKAVDEDILQVKDSQKYKSILRVLIKGRICSNVEEITFCALGYPSNLLDLDLDLSKLATNEEKLENRFKRLRYIEVLNCDVKTAGGMLSDIKGTSKFLLDEAKEKKMRAKVLCDAHKDTWWNSHSLRSKWYTMDEEGSTLDKYFKRVQLDIGERTRKEKLAKIQSNENIELLNKEIPVIKSVLNMLLDIVDKGDALYNSSSIIDKSEWSRFVKRDNMFRGVYVDLSNNSDLMKELKVIGLFKIEDILRKSGLDEELADKINLLGGIVFQEILKEDTDYRSGANKLSFDKSIESLKKLALKILNLEIDIVYTCYAKYLTRNTVDFVSFYFEQVKDRIVGLKYTMNTIHNCNFWLDTGLAKQAFDVTDAVEVYVADLPIDKRYLEAIKILDGLAEGVQPQRRYLDGR